MIFIVIPVFNRIQLTRQCLLSIQSQTFKNYTTIVVDDGSTDGTSELIAREFPNVIVLKGNGNLWWTGATNLGVKYTLENFNKPESFILTLNNDLEVPENYLEVLIKSALNNFKSIIGSVSVDINDLNKLSYCGVKWNSFTAKYYSIAQDYGYNYATLLKSTKSITTDLLPGRGTLIPLDIFNKIGLYDFERFPHYAADEDLSLQARKLGYQLLIPTNTYVKSHLTETGIGLQRVCFNLKSIKEFFLSIKSPFNLKIRYRWAIKNTPLKIIYFVIDISRVCASLFVTFLFKK